MFMCCRCSCFTRSAAVCRSVVYLCGLVLTCNAGMNVLLGPFESPTRAGEEDCGDGGDEYLDICLEETTVATTASPVTASPSSTPTAGPSTPPSRSPSGAPGTSAPTASPTEGCDESEFECEESGLCLPGVLACDGELLLHDDRDPLDQQRSSACSHGGGWETFLGLPTCVHCRRGRLRRRKRRIRLCVQRSFVSTDNFSTNFFTNNANSYKHADGNAASRLLRLWLSMRIDQLVHTRVARMVSAHLVIMIVQGDCNCAQKSAKLALFRSHPVSF